MFFTMMVISVVIRNHLRRFCCCFFHNWKRRFMGLFKGRCGFKYRCCRCRLFKYLRGLRCWRLFKYLMRLLVKYLFLYGRFLCLNLLLVSFACSGCTGCSLRRFKYLRLRCWRLFKYRLRLRGYCCCWRLSKNLLMMRFRRLLIKYLFLNMGLLFKCC